MQDPFHLVQLKILYQKDFDRFFLDKTMPHRIFIT